MRPWSVLESRAPGVRPSAVTRRIADYGGPKHVDCMQRDRLAWTMMDSLIAVHAQQRPLSELVTPRCLPQASLLRLPEPTTVS
jgi:hypothetical protein